MSRPSAQEFLQALLETLDDLPPDFARRFEEVLKKEDVDRSQAIRQLFEDSACEGAKRGAGVRPSDRAKQGAQGAPARSGAGLGPASDEPGCGSHARQPRVGPGVGRSPT
jgi:hypothetical protein